MGGRRRHCTDTNQQKRALKHQTNSALSNAAPAFPHTFVCGLSAVEGHGLCFIDSLIRSFLTISPDWDFTRISLIFVMVSDFCCCCWLPALANVSGTSFPTPMVHPAAMMVNAKGRARCLVLAHSTPTHTSTHPLTPYHRFLAFCAYP